MECSTLVSFSIKQCNHSSIRSKRELFVVYFLFRQRKKIKITNTILFKKEFKRTRLRRSILIKEKRNDKVQCLCLDNIQSRYYCHIQSIKRIENVCLSGCIIANKGNSLQYLLFLIIDKISRELCDILDIIGKEINLDLILDGTEILNLELQYHEFASFCPYSIILHKLNQIFALIVQIFEIVIANHLI